MIALILLLLLDTFSCSEFEHIPIHENKTITPGKRNQNVWNMIQEFGKTFNVTHWVLYANFGKDPKWNKFWHSSYKKEKQNSYYGTDSLSYTEQKTKFKENTLHLYVNDRLEQLEEYMIELNKDLKNHEPFGPNKRSTLKSNVWLIKMPYNASMQLMVKILNRTQAAYDSNIYCFTERDDETIDILDVYKIALDTTTILKNYGTWNHLYGLRVIEPEIWSRRKSLEGHNFEIASAYSPPAITLINDNCNRKTCIKGMFADVLHALSNKMNFTFTIRRSYQWGSFINGTWNGMVGMLERKESDLAVTDLTVTRDRASAVDFLPSLMEVNEELFMKNPGESLSMDAYIAPFSPDSWIGIGLWAIMVPLILAIILFYSEHKGYPDIELSYCYNLVAQTLIMRSPKKLPQSVSSRIAFASVMLTGIAFYYHWEAELVSYLAVRKTHLPFKNLKELANHPKYKVIVGQGSIHLDQFRYSNDPIQKKIWKEKIEPYESALPLYEDLVKYMINDQNLVAYAESGIRQYESYINCEIINIAPVYSVQLAWAMQKHSPFYLAFNHYIRRLKEIGAIQRYDKRYEIKDQWCPDYSGKPLSINQCITAFNVLVVGVVGGLAWFILEIIVPQQHIQQLYTIVNNLLHRFLMKIAIQSTNKNQAISFS